MITRYMFLKPELHLVNKLTDCTAGYKGSIITQISAVKHFDRQAKGQNKSIYFKF